MILVLDGAGGMGGGGRAAELGLEALSATSELTNPAAMESFLRTLDALVVDDPQAGETTAIVARVVGDRVVGASAGDSSLWLIADGDYVDLTSPQHRMRLGSDRTQPVSFSARLPSGCRLLAGTDGLFNYARPHELAASAVQPDLESAADRLLQLVRLPSGALQDDVAFVLVDVRPSARMSALGSSV